MTTKYTTRLTALIAAAKIEAAHDYLTAIRPPVGTRYFGTTPNRGDHLFVSTVMRPETADAYRACADDVAGVSILPSVSPYVSATTYPALPAMGDQVEAGQIYDAGGALWMARQTHTRTEHAPDAVLALFMRYRDQAEGSDWIAAEQVEVGDHRTHGGELYRCIQAHVTQGGWEPDLLPALWELLEPPGEEPAPEPVPDPDPATPEWAPGLSVTVGEIYTYQGTDYRCITGHTTQSGWTPPVVPALWEPV